ncbi:class I glutamine amidotransferase-like protein [Abortiporus biennis]|nr:class I glutamine amidotransferase-like protein [Abortiporus biennis]
MPDSSPRTSPANLKPTPIPRIAVFLCDHAHPDVQATSGDYDKIFHTLLSSSYPPSKVKQGEEIFILDAYNVRDSTTDYPEDVDVYDGIILTGSAANAYENVPWINKLVGYVAWVAKDKPKIKLFGICFGHQIIARSLGTEVVPNDGKWEVGITPITLSEVGKKVFGVEDDTVNLQQMHRDHVPSLPPNCLLLGSTKISYNQGFIRLPPGTPSSTSTHTQTESVPPFHLSQIQIFTVQGHPEFSQQIVSSLINTREKNGILTKEIADSARERGSWRNDGVGVVGRAVWRILVDERIQPEEGLEG